MIGIKMTAAFIQLRSVNEIFGRNDKSFVTNTVLQSSQSKNEVKQCS